MDLSQLVPLLAGMNKATITAGVNWASTNIALGMLHVSVGSEWQQLAVTLIVAIVHGIVVYYTPNKVKAADGSYVTVDHNVIAAMAAGLEAPK